MEEIILNLREIKHRTKILMTLCFRHFIKQKVRTIKNSYKEYDFFWDSFWDKKVYLNTDYPMLKNDALINPNITSLEFIKKGYNKNTINKNIRFKDNVSFRNWFWGWIKFIIIGSTIP